MPLHASLQKNDPADAENQSYGVLENSVHHQLNLFPENWVTINSTENLTKNAIPLYCDAAN